MHPLNGCERRASGVRHRRRFRYRAGKDLRCWRGCERRVLAATTRVHCNWRWKGASCEAEAASLPTMDGTLRNGGAPLKLTMDGTVATSGKKPLQLALASSNGTAPGQRRGAVATGGGRGRHSYAHRRSQCAAEAAAPLQAEAASPRQVKGVRRNDASPMQLAVEGSVMRGRGGHATNDRRHSPQRRSAVATGGGRGRHARPGTASPHQVEGNLRNGGAPLQLAMDDAVATGGGWGRHARPRRPRYQRWTALSATAWHRCNWRGRGGSTTSPTQIFRKEGVGNLAESSGLFDVSVFQEGLL